MPNPDPVESARRRTWTIRQTELCDRGAILALTKAAFTKRPGDDGSEEVKIVVDTWVLGAAVPGLDLIAVEDGEVIGHVLGAAGDLAGHKLIGIAPLSVRPDRQRRGVGSDLMREVLRRADEAGWPAVVLLGDPAYYTRFGFETAGVFGLIYEPVGHDNPHFMVRRLSDFARGLRGSFKYCWERIEQP